MSKRNKLLKFAELLSFPNVYENFDPRHPVLAGEHGQETSLQGRWASQHFGNSWPITAELACGRGEYSLAMARTTAERNYIGVDVKGARLWKGAKIALEEQLHQVAFLRIRIEQLALFFGPAELDELWITFPDPFLETGKINRRLTAPNFLEEYRKVLRPGGTIHLKTDSPELYAFTLETLAETPGAQLRYFDDDIYARPLPLPELAFKTYYENQHLRAGKTIKYIQFEL